MFLYILYSISTPTQIVLAWLLVQKPFIAPIPGTTNLHRLQEILVGQAVEMGRKSVAGSLIGGIAETQEMLDFCGEHNVVSEIEIIKMQDINEAYECK